MIGSKLIGLKFVGSSISPDLWIGIMMECFLGLGNTFVTIDELIINVIYGIKITLIIIIIIKKGRQCKAEREWYTPHQSEDPGPTIPTCIQKEEKGKKSRRL